MMWWLFWLGVIFAALVCALFFWQWKELRMSRMKRRQEMAYWHRVLRDELRRQHLEQQIAVHSAEYTAERSAVQEAESILAQARQR